MLLHQLSYALITLNALDSNRTAQLNSFYEAARSVSSFYYVNFRLADIKEYLASSVINTSSQLSKLNID